MAKSIFPSFKKVQQRRSKQIICYKAFIPKIFDSFRWTACEFYLSNFHFFIHLYVCWKGFYPCPNSRGSI